MNDELIFIKGRSILILGGSYLQEEFISTAIELGCKVTVVDGDANCHISSTYADISFVCLDFSRADQVYDLAKCLKVQLVYAPANEIGNKTASIVNERLGIDYNSQSTVEASLNKSLQYDILKTVKGLSIPDSERFVVEPTTDGFNFPLIIKPSTSSASRGVRLVEASCDFSYAFQDAKRYLRSLSDSIIVQQYVQGLQISVETLSFKGRHTVVGIVQEFLSGPPLFIERYHMTSSTIFDNFHEKVEDIVIDILNALNVSVGPSHIELIINDKEVFLVEVATRAGGWRDMLLKTAGGVNLNKEILRCYFGLGPSLITEYIPKMFAQVNLLLKKEDMIVYERASQNGVVVEEYFNGKQPVQTPTNLLDCYGYVYISSDCETSKYKLNRTV